ncbi:MAG: aspartate carbamoyltransferase catalytic subunit [Chloroflexota bacterium]|nr:aspartate carbamoyltransferase catalytic subunit [Chloroflexota bacterium]
MIKDTVAKKLLNQNHLLDLDGFSQSDIQAIFDNTDSMMEVLDRGIRKVPALRGKTVITLFSEASTRTRVSFEQAGKILSADVINVSSDGSSSKKGESLYNTALTLQAMKADAIVVRHQHSGAGYFLAQQMRSTSIINAGDGMHAHPTQSLLDLYTIKKHLGDIESKRVVIVGDLLYSRVARSNLWGLTTMGADIVLCGPNTLLPQDFLDSRLDDVRHPFKNITIENDINKALSGANVVMALRLQSERQKAGHLPSLREYSRRFGINSERLKLAHPEAIVMHPGPMNEGVEIEPDVAHGQQSVIESQVTTGVAIRMAILYDLITGNRPEKEL